MRRFMLHLETGIDFVDGDGVSDEIVHHYERHLAETVQKAAKTLSLRTINDNRVVAVQVGEIKVSL